MRGPDGSRRGSFPSEVSPLRPIPFDSLTLAAIVCELRALEGGRIQRIVQPEPSNVSLSVYAGGTERHLLLSCAQPFVRAHLVRSKPAGITPLPRFASSLRAKLDGGRLASIRQVGFDRILELDVNAKEGDFRIIAELTGRHANVVLADSDGLIVSALRIVGGSKSSRPVLPGRSYERPPTMASRSLWEASSSGELKGAEGASAFLANLLCEEAGESGGAQPGSPNNRLRKRIDELRETVGTCAFRPVRCGEWGVYPVSVASLGYEEEPCESLSSALEGHFSRIERERETEAVRKALLAQLGRVLLAREVAIQGLEDALEAAVRAPEIQRQGDLLLAYASLIPEGASEFAGEDFEGKPIRIPLDPEAGPVENANRLFERAKRAKARAGEVEEQLERMKLERHEVSSAIRRAQEAREPEALSELRAEASGRRWLHSAARPEAAEDRPFEGHRIRELLGPGGVAVLYGENSTANDYLTTRVARPSDYWLHVRGSASAHVVIRTEGRPERIGKEALLFAAKIAARNSPGKHSGIVPVDYTLKKHVRKPRGSPPGTAHYSHEKTLHVELGR